jgi:hypothetical protein
MTIPNVFTAEVSGGERPLFAADSLVLQEKWPPSTPPVWHGNGEQKVSSAPDIRNVFMNVYVTEGVELNKELKLEHDKRIKVNYTIQKEGIFEEYDAVSGVMTLTNVPSTKDKEIETRLEGTVSFTAEYLGKKVTITNGKFVLSDEKKTVASKDG